MSTENWVTLVQQAAARSVTSILQRAASTAQLIQVLRLDCEEVALARHRQILTCYNNAVNTTPPRSREWIQTNCVDALAGAVCEANNLVLRQALSLDVDANQRQQLVTRVEQGIEAEITSSIQADSRLELNSTVRNDINRLARQTTSMFQAAAQDLFSGVYGQQVITIQGGPVRFLTLEQATEALLTEFQNDQVWVNATQDVAAVLRAESVSATRTLDTIVGVAVAVVGVAILTAVLVVVLRKANVAIEDMPDIKVPGRVSSGPTKDSRPRPS